MRFKRDEKMKEGHIQVYTGKGKGKTTAALGLAIRAAGRGMRVLIIQFMKNRPSGERNFLKDIDQIKVENYGTSDFISKDDIREEDRIEVKKALDRAKEALGSKAWDVIIFDEINVVLDLGILEVDEFIQFIDRNWDGDVEIVLTGRNAPKEIIDLAILVTEMKKIKHPYDQGIGPREGIEY